MTFPSVLLASVGFEFYRFQEGALRCSRPLPVYSMQAAFGHTLPFVVRYSYEPFLQFLSISTCRVWKRRLKISPQIRFAIFMCLASIFSAHRGCSTMCTHYDLACSAYFLTCAPARFFSAMAHSFGAMAAYRSNACRLPSWLLFGVVWCRDSVV